MISKKNRPFQQSSFPARTRNLWAALAALMVAGMLFAFPAAGQEQKKAAPEAKTPAPDSKTPPSDDSKTAKGPVSEPSPSPTPEAPKKGDIAPDFTLEQIPSGKMQLSSLRGKAVLINFWATWCEPCKLEMPWLVDLQKKYGSQGLEIVGVSMDDEDNSEIQKFARKMGVNYPILKGTEDVAEQYGGLDGLPSSFFVDRSGKISDAVIGLVSQSVIEEDIKRALGQAKAAPAVEGK